MSLYEASLEQKTIDEKLLIVVGDVHGDYDQLITPYNFYKCCTNAKLIYIGDYCSYSPDNNLVYDHVVSTMNDPNIIYIRGNHEGRNYDRNEYFYKYKVLDYKNAFAVDENLDPVNEWDKVKYLFTHAEFCPKPGEFPTVSDVDKVPVDEIDQFIYRYEKLSPEEEEEVKSIKPYQNIFGHLHAYDLANETMDKFMQGQIKNLCIDIDSSFIYNNGCTTNVCFLILKKSDPGYEVVKKKIRHDPKKKPLHH
ncbi:hypothetical protein TRFO_09950 [Tritrichomonas foetus]|uniref:Calcineurin-like phosphoesterase domain-containing protein n=1 Tax=Tritrichomonas foetus TaxID=1144522 RepID=A0A1J4JGJ3_9EUKA|nr:hypothetical protein TRFO_09950 [Tritrichomonas foetus]|eukprot:OHS96324.1 hypothetical protein TRFO_09950 [Tritrichomonas foetus]